MTWEDLVEMEPRLAALADVAVSLGPDDGVAYGHLLRLREGA